MRGDHLKVRRGVYTHHGIDLGDGMVVNYGGARETAKARVSLVPRTDFASGSKVRIVDGGKGQLPSGEVVHRALGRLGENVYNLIGSNCEHLAMWSQTGWHESVQVAGPWILRSNWSPVYPLYLLYGVPVMIEWNKRQAQLDAPRLCPECKLTHGWLEGGGIALTNDSCAGGRELQQT